MPLKRLVTDPLRLLIDPLRLVIDPLRLVSDPLRLLMNRLPACLWSSWPETMTSLQYQKCPIKPYQTQTLSNPITHAVDMKT